VGRGVIKPDCDRLRPLQDLPPPGNMRAIKRVLGPLNIPSGCSGFHTKFNIWNALPHFRWTS